MQKITQEVISSVNLACYGACYRSEKASGGGKFKQ